MNTKVHIPAISVGKHEHYTQCRFCSHNIIPFIDFGYVPLAGGFFPKSTTNSMFAKELLYPLQICFCKHCYLVQCNSSIDSDVLFKNYYYSSSTIKTLVNHFKDLAHDLTSITKKCKHPFVVEIGCNDGVLLRPLLHEGYRVIGVDPATRIVRPPKQDGIPIINNNFTRKVAQSIISSKGHADVVISSHSFAHIANMHEIMKGVSMLLKKNGVLVIEAHYLGDLIDGMQYDMMYHEHQFYYSILTLQKFFNLYTMEIFDVKHFALRGGTIRVYIQFSKTGVRTITPSVKQLMTREKNSGYKTYALYKRFSTHVSTNKKQLITLIKTIKKNGHMIAGYGASGRATSIMSYCGITHEDVRYVIDDAPEKIGAFTPGNHIPIVSSKLLSGKHRPDYVILFAWPFAKEVISKHQKYLQNGGKFIIPLPHISMIDRNYGFIQ